MDTTACEGAFTRAAGASEGDGDFGWNDKKTSFTFTSKTLLGYATQYTARINGGAARSANGSPLDKDASVSFTTLALPDIINTYPHEGDMLSAYGGFGVQFSAPMKLDDIKSRITFNPKPTIIDPDYGDSEGFNYNTGLGFDPSTSYTVTIDVNGLVDRYGPPFQPNPNSKIYRIVRPAN